MITRFPFAHTYSIVARDPQTGDLGVAVQSHWFSVGSTVSWAMAGTGVVATQAMTEASYGPLGLELMRAGKSAADALRALLAVDEERELRQVAMIDGYGNVAAHTGARCIAEAGHEIGEGFSVQANMMLKASVWPAMAEAYRRAQGDLIDRMLAALDAAQSEGGDIRGKQSACLLVVTGQSSGAPWQDRNVELRIEDHPEPLAELRRLVRIHRAYQHMNQGDKYLELGDVSRALEAYRAAVEFYPENLEIPFWHAVTLVDMGKVDEAFPIFERLFREDPNWALLAVRLPEAGLMKADAGLLERIQSWI